MPVAILSPFVRHRLLSLMAAERQDDLVVLAEMAESGKLTPAVDRRYPLVEAPARSDMSERGMPEARSSSPSDRSTGTS